MTAAPSPVALLGALIGLFLGGAAVGGGLAAVLAPESWLAQAVSFFALPVAFAAGLQAWYGLALLSLIPRVLRVLSGSRPPPGALRTAGAPRLPGSFVFLPLSSGAGALAGTVVGIVSSAYPFWVILPVYWLVGTVHGLLAWRLARSGVLVPPESV